MKKFIFILFIGLLVISCEKEKHNEIEEEEVNVSLSYSLSYNNGNSMYDSKSLASEVFERFYAAISDGSLIAPTFDLTFTEVNKGWVYSVQGDWETNNIAMLRTGTYHVTGSSTAEGLNLQEKCSITFDTQVVVNLTDGVITLPAIYDCALIVFTDATVSNLSNNNGAGETTDFFHFENYYYAFVRTALYEASGRQNAYISGHHITGKDFTVSTSSLELQKGKYYVYNNVAIELQIPYMEEGDIESDETINLSAEGTANCYIINNAGTYKFNGSVKGNSTESVGEPVSASVIWETFNSSTAPSVGDVISNVSLSNGVVQFSSTGYKGNALIAVKDAENKILWSWHIWVTDYDPNTDYDTYTGHQSVKMMDRNLGAMSSEPGTSSIGLIYEWGRKDPFMGSTSLTSYSQFASTVSFPDCKTSTSTIGTEKYATENPTQYIIANSQNQDWLYTSDNSAWSSEKSKNDPCPKGWKVPEGGQNSVWSSFPSSISSTSGVTWNSTYNGINVSESLATNPVWYPAQGYHGDSDTYSSSFWQVGSEGRYWTTSTLGKGSDYFQFKSSTIETYHTSTSTHFSRANGMPVRCCSE